MTQSHELLVASLLLYSADEREAFELPPMLRRMPLELGRFYQLFPGYIPGVPAMFPVVYTCVCRVCTEVN